MTQFSDCRINVSLFLFGVTEGIEAEAGVIAHDVLLNASVLE